MPSGMGGAMRKADGSHKPKGSLLQTVFPKYKGNGDPGNGEQWTKKKAAYHIYSNMRRMHTLQYSKKEKATSLSWCNRVTKNKVRVQFCCSIYWKSSKNVPHNRVNTVGFNIRSPVEWLWPAPDEKECQQCKAFVEFYTSWHPQVRTTWGMTPYVRLANNWLSAQ